MLSRTNDLEHRPRSKYLNRAETFGLFLFGNFCWNETLNSICARGDVAAVNKNDEVIVKPNYC